MPNTRTIVKSRINLLRNLRIVWLKNERGMSYQEIADQLVKEGHNEVSRQNVAAVYRTYKDIPFYYEDDKVIIH